ncbi:hypothetical protein AB1Y20_017916 [Prymnesium parvum]|uniref:Arf-GAP with coiled-coil, ANK repeat and PH domain-containing protein 2 n=1 Tax=Prymnesium parvum TaxID=97485 RepID=A0AB34JQE3_PRYPA
MALSLLEAWEAVLEHDTPHYREELRNAVQEAARIHKQVSHLVGLSQTFLKAADAMAEARRELVQGLVTAGSEAFGHPDLHVEASDSTSRLAQDVGSCGEMLSQLGLAEKMQSRQVQSLVLEPLQALLDDPRGLSCINKMHSAFGSTSADFYETFQELVTLDSDGHSAASAKAHARTTAAAATKMGSAVISQVGSRFGLGIGALSRRINQFGEGSSPAPAAAPVAAPAAESSGGVKDAPKESVDGQQSTRSASTDLQASAIKQQEAMLKSRHALESRLLEACGRARLQLGKQLCDYFYATYSHAHQQTTLLERTEEVARGLQAHAEAAVPPLGERVRKYRRQGAALGALCAAFDKMKEAPKDGPTGITADDLRCLAPLIGRANGEEGVPATRQGVLFVQQGLLRQWRRCWCVLHASTLSLFKLGATADGQARWRDRSIVEIQLTLCNVKPHRVGSRFYLEVRSPNDHLSLQSLSEASMRSWATAIQAAVAKAFGGTNDPSENRSPRSKALGTALRALQAQGAVCADCGAAGPEWASINLCVPICLECAGCHRAMGTHVSRVRSLHLDAWEPPLIHLLESLQSAPLTPPPPPPPPPPRSQGSFDISDGPTAASAAPPPPPPLVGPNAVWEARLPATVRRPLRSDSEGGPGPREHREVFVRLKYEIKEFILPASELAPAQSSEERALALGERLWDACTRDDALAALQLLAAGADAQWSQADAAAAGEEGGAALSVLEKARACGASKCVELLCQFGAAQQSAPQADALAPPVSPVAALPAEALKAVAAAHASVEGAELPVDFHALADVSAADVSNAISRNAEAAAEAAAAAASSAAASASAAFAMFTGGHISSQVHVPSFSSFFGGGDAPAEAVAAVSLPSRRGGREGDKATSRPPAAALAHDAELSRRWAGEVMAIDRDAPPPPPRAKLAAGTAGTPPAARASPGGGQALSITPDKEQAAAAAPAVVDVSAEASSCGHAAEATAAVPEGVAAGDAHAEPELLMLGELGLADGGSGGACVSSSELTAGGGEAGLQAGATADAGVGLESDLLVESAGDATALPAAPPTIEEAEQEKAGVEMESDLLVESAGDASVLPAASATIEEAEQEKAGVEMESDLLVESAGDATLLPAASPTIEEAEQEKAGVEMESDLLVESAGDATLLPAASPTIEEAEQENVVASTVSAAKEETSPSKQETPQEASFLSTD